MRLSLATWNAVCRRAFWKASDIFLWRETKEDIHSVQYMWLQCERSYNLWAECHEKEAMLEPSPWSRLSTSFESESDTWCRGYSVPCSATMESPGSTTWLPLHSDGASTWSNRPHESQIWWSKMGFWLSLVILVWRFPLALGFPECHFPTVPLHWWRQVHREHQMQQVLLQSQGVAIWKECWLDSQLGWMTGLWGYEWPLGLWLEANNCNSWELQLDTRM